MDIDQGFIMTFEAVFKVVVGAIVGYIMYKFKKLEEKAELSITAAQARELIKDKMEPLEVRIEELKEDTRRMESKIDRIIEKL